MAALPVLSVPPPSPLGLTSYPGAGARYAAHTDTFEGDPARRVTAILYLNPDWRPGDGGTGSAEGGKLHIRD